MPLSLPETAVIAVYYFVLLVLTVFAAHRLHLLRLVRRSAGHNPALPAEPEVWPSVCVQLPVYNEPLVVRRLLEAAVGIDYPGHLSIQLLDDSTDETTRIAEQLIESLPPGSPEVALIRRPDRAGYKAGALQHGLHLTDADLIAVFDADFVPPEDFLTRVVPHFADPAIGMVQCRWAHLNRRVSLLTRIQALYLDAHFAVESPARFRAGLFFNFNGTAGVWRREAIEEAGGWSAETVTEDLDLSYRAQLAGWRFLYLEDVTVPAELPTSLQAFHGQQYRWAKGSLQTARRQLPRIWASSASPAARVEATFHLTNNLAYLFTLMLVLLIVPASAIRYSSGFGPTLLIDALLFSICTSSLIAFYREGQKRAGRRPPRIYELVATIPLGVGLSIVNTRAAIEGLLTRAGTFNRTPKQGASSSAPVESPPRQPVGEILVTIWLAGTLGIFATSGIWLAIPFLLLFLSGFGSTSLISGLELARWVRARKARDFS